MCWSFLHCSTVYVEVQCSVLVLQLYNFHVQAGSDKLCDQVYKTQSGPRTSKEPMYFNLNVVFNLIGNKRLYVSRQS